jgi:hypothetical protein
MNQINCKAFSGQDTSKIPKNFNILPQKKHL